MKKLLALLLSLSLLTVFCAGCAEAPTPTPDAPATENPDAPAPPPEDAPTSPTDPTPEGAINAVTAWGISTEAGEGIANGMTLYEKISALPNGSTVYFPAGTYALDLPLLLSGKRDIRIVGDDAVFLNTRAVNTAATQPASTDPAIPASLRPSTATSGMVWIEGCQNITIEGITFRYATATSISGVVTAKASTFAEIRVTDGSALTGDEYVMAINTFTATGMPDRTLEQYAAASFPVERISDDTLRISGINADALSINTRVCLRTSLSSNYVFTIFNSSDLTFRDLTLNNSLNGGFLIEHRTVNATFERITVKSHNEGALMSLNADALHLTGLGGELIIRDCSFERAGDDFLNVSGAAGKLRSISANERGTTLSVTLSWGADSRWAAAGDTIEFYDPDTLALLGSAVVTEADGLNLTFDAIPAGVTTKTVLSNKTLHPKVLIENCTFTNNRARALLIQTDDVTVRNCTFSFTALAAILVSPDLATWDEVSPTRGLTIEDCSFMGCGSSASGVIQITTNHDSPTHAAAAPIHRDIAIRDCTFSSVVPAVYAVSCQNLTFTGNTTTAVNDAHVLSLIACDTVTHDAALVGRLYTKNCTNITRK